MNVGGAQRQVIELVKALDKHRDETTIITFYDGGALRPEAAAIEGRVTLVSVGKQGRWDVLPFLYRLWRQVRAVKPNVVYSFLPLPNVIAATLKPLFSNVRVVWGIRACIGAEDVGLWGRLLLGLERRLARRVDLIIANSNAAREACQAHGFPASKILVIPNGFDTTKFRPDSDGRRRLRAEWGISDQEILIGLAGRLDPLKDHPTFLRAAALLSRERTDVHFVCVGGGEADYQRELKSLAEALGLRNRVVWAGARVDMPSVYSAFDIATVCSRSESFCNALGEAMSCGVPCVATRVGDSELIVGDTWPIIPREDPEALAQSWKTVLEALRQDGQRMRQCGRERIASEFSAAELARRTMAAIEALCR